MNEETTQLNTRQPFEVKLGFDTKEGMDALLRAANVLCSSSLVPVAYRKTLIDKNGTATENPNGLANCAVALNMASRMGADPLLIMQNLHIIEGRPSWSSAFIIASINQCGRFSPVRFVLSQPEAEIEVPYIYTEWETVGNSDKRRPVEKTGVLKVRHQECFALATEKATGERIEGPRITMQMAIDEGWLQKKGSKWKTMQEIMLRYRAASLFGRLYAPELLMGLQSAEESQDIVDAEFETSPYVPPAMSSAPQPEAISIWSIASQEAFDDLMDEAYLMFKEQNLEQHFPVFEKKWRPRRNKADDKGALRDLRLEIDSLKPKDAQQ